MNNWAVEIQNGVFDMTALLVDLIAARLAYSPVPVRLLETLAILFNCDSVFQKKHRTKAYDRSLYHKQLGERVLASPSSTPTFPLYGHNDPYGWLCELINRFVSKDGVVHLKRQFQTDRPLTSRVNILYRSIRNVSLSRLGIQRLTDTFCELYGVHFSGQIPHPLRWTYWSNYASYSESERGRFQSEGAWRLLPRLLSVLNLCFSRPITFLSFCRRSGKSSPLLCPIVSIRWNNCIWKRYWIWSPHRVSMQRWIHWKR